MLTPFLGLGVVEVTGEVTGTGWVTFSRAVVGVLVTVLSCSEAVSADAGVVVVEGPRETGISVASWACSVGQSVPPPPAPQVGPVEGETEILAPSGETV